MLNNTILGKVQRNYFSYWSTGDVDHTPSVIGMTVGMYPPSVCIITPSFQLPTVSTTWKSSSSQRVVQRVAIAAASNALAVVGQDVPSDSSSNYTAPPRPQHVHGWDLGPWEVGNPIACMYAICCPKCAMAEARSAIDGSNCCFNFCCFSIPALLWFVGSTYGVKTTCFSLLCCIDGPFVTNRAYQTALRLGNVSTDGGKGRNSNIQEYWFPRNGGTCTTAMLCPRLYSAYLLRRYLGMDFCTACTTHPWAAMNLLRYHYRIFGSEVCCECALPLLGLVLCGGWMGPVVSAYSCCVGGGIERQIRSYQQTYLIQKTISMEFDSTIDKTNAAHEVSPSSNRTQVQAVVGDVVQSTRQKTKAHLRRTCNTLKDVIKPSQIFYLHNNIAHPSSSSLTMTSKYKEKSNAQTIGMMYIMRNGSKAVKNVTRCSSAVEKLPPDDNRPIIESSCNDIAEQEYHSPSSVPIKSSSYESIKQQTLLYIKQRHVEDMDDLQ